MPLARVRFSRFSGQVCSAVAALALAAGCSTPKTAAVPAAKPGPAVVEAAGHSNSTAQSDPFVAAVRAGTMSGYPQATIGQAFEGAFSDAQWRSEQPKE